MYSEPFETIPVEKLVAPFRTADAMHKASVKILKAHYNSEGYTYTLIDIQYIKAYYL